MIETITNVNSFVNGLVWGWPALILLGFVGVLMTILTHFFQITHFGHWVRQTIGAIFGNKHVTQHTTDRSISQFQSLCTALAATVGTGNIVGVAGAIAVGGPGAVFWMWLIAFFGMMTNFSENVLGILYRRKNMDGEWCGGAMYYLRDGLGSSVMVHSNSNVKEPVRQGMWGIFEVFADTIVVCTLTALTILTSGAIDLNTGLMTEEAAAIGSSSLMSYAFRQTFGSVGAAFIAIAILLFAYSTVLGWSHYGSKACEYIFGTKSITIYRIVFSFIVLAGSMMKAQLAWDISDTFNGLMMLPNLIGVIALSPVVMKCTKNYIDRRILNKTGLEPMLSAFPDVQAEQVADFGEND